jgi:hypothetical protein
LLVPLLSRVRPVPVLTGLLLVCTLLIPVWSRGATALAATALVVAGAAGLRLMSPRRPASAPKPRRRVGPRAVIDMVLYLSPVLLLTFAFPFAVARITDSQVAGVPLTTLLLASSLTVPWLGVAVCLPLYRAVGALIGGGDMDAIRSRFCAVWPATFAQTAPAVLVFAVPLQVVMHWPVTAWLTYVALCVLHAAFAQSLVVANIGKRRVVWALAWVSYAATLLLVPSLWFLPPVVGLASQLLFMRGHLGAMRHPARLEHADVVHDMGRGVLLGAVLWAHLLLVFLKTGGGFAVTALFVGLFPGVLAYNYYFVRLAPSFDRAVVRMRSAMEDEPHHRLRGQSASLASVVDRSLQRTAAVCAGLSFVVVLAVDLLGQQPVGLVATVAVASWFFMMTTLVCYKLDYIGHRGQAQLFSGVHLLLSVVAFVTLPVGVWLYAGLIAASALVFPGALYLCRQQWRSSDYALFWRHATAW